MMRYEDGRNTYGSRGGYVRDSAYDRRGGDMAPYGDRRDMAPYGDRYGRMDRHGADPRVLMTWSRRLYDELEEKEKQDLRDDTIERKAYDMGIHFDRFSPEELYTTVLMLYTDFKSVLGQGNSDLYLKLAKAWLCDPDAGVRYGDKLMAYYESVVNGF